METEILLLGTGTCVPSLQRSAPSVAVTVAGETILFDMGWGTLRRLLEARVEQDRIRYVFLTHSHPDHTSDLLPLLFSGRNRPDSPRLGDIHVCGPAHLGRVFDSLLDIYGSWLESPAYDIEFHDLERETIATQRWAVRASPTRHSIPSLAYRMDTEDGKSVVYSGDTDYSPELIDLARGADVLISECSFPEGERQPGHLDPSLAAGMAEQAGCARLVLVHLYPACDKVDIASQCAKYYGGEVIVGSDLLRIRI